jgi:hypothetical protein
MNNFKLRITAPFVAITPFFAQIAQASPDDAQAAAGCAACSGGMFMMFIAPLIIQVAILAWVVKDSRARGIESPLGWMAFVFLVPVIGILVYLFSRPPLKTE